MQSRVDTQGWSHILHLLSFLKLTCWYKMCILCILLCTCTLCVLSKINTICFIFQLLYFVTFWAAPITKEDQKSRDKVVMNCVKMEQKLISCRRGEAVGLSVCVSAERRSSWCHSESLNGSIFANLHLLYWTRPVTHNDLQVKSRLTQSHNHMTPTCIKLVMELVVIPFWWCSCVVGKVSVNCRSTCEPATVNLFLLWQRAWLVAIKR